MVYLNCNIVNCFPMHLIISDGQSIAYRLARRLQKVAKMVKTSITAYNKASNPDSQITWTDAINPCGDIYNIIQCSRDDEVSLMQCSDDMIVLGLCFQQGEF